MWMVETDLEKNRMYILIGEIHEDNYMNFFLDVDMASQKLKPGFSLVTDIRLIKFDSTHSLMTWHQKLKELLVLREVGDAVQIIDDNTKKIHVEFDRLSREAGFHASPVKTLFDAQKKLD